MGWTQSKKFVFNRNVSREFKIMSKVFRFDDGKRDKDEEQITDMRNSIFMG